MKPSASEIKLARVRAADLLKMPMRCAWRGCKAHFTVGEMPHDWIHLLTWWTREYADVRVMEIASSPDCQRDAVLCPAHAAALEDLLEDIGNRLRRPAQGSA